MGSVKLVVCMYSAHKLGGETLLYLGVIVQISSPPGARILSVIAIDHATAKLSYVLYSQKHTYHFHRNLFSLKFGIQLQQCPDL